jgi:hypothetical protein
MSPRELPGDASDTVASETAAPLDLVTVDPSISFVGARAAITQEAGILSFPTETHGTGYPAMFGPSFEIGVVPEPGALPLLGSGLVGLARLRLPRRNHGRVEAPIWLTPTPHSCLRVSSSGG